MNKGFFPVNCIELPDRQTDLKFDLYNAHDGSLGIFVLRSDWDMSTGLRSQIFFKNNSFREVKFIETSSHYIMIITGMIFHSFLDC